MLIDWSYFGPALALLLLPIGLFHGKNSRHRGLTRDWSGQWGLFFTLPHHTIDLLPAGAGAWLLTRGLAVAPGATGIMKHAPLLTHAAVLSLGALLQTIPCREPDSAYAPFTYLTGLVFGFAPTLVASLAFILASVTAL